ncbi:MAG: hypothetical protein ACLPYW_08040 [Acidimicrobiales bacterium]
MQGAQGSQGRQGAQGNQGAQGAQGIGLGIGWEYQNSTAVLLPHSESVVVAVIDPFPNTYYNVAVTTIVHTNASVFCFASAQNGTSSHSVPEIQAASNKAPETQRTTTLTIDGDLYAGHATARIDERCRTSGSGEHVLATAMVAVPLAGMQKSAAAHVVRAEAQQAEAASASLPARLRNRFVKHRSP